MINLGTVVLLALDGAVLYGVVTQKRSVLQDGAEREFFRVQYGPAINAFAEREENQIVESDTWSDARRLRFLRENGGGDWATEYARLLLNPKAERETSAPAGSDPENPHGVRIVPLGKPTPPSTDSDIPL